MAHNSPSENRTPRGRPTDITIRRIATGDAQALADFYNGLGPESIHAFHPLGPKTTIAACEEIIRNNQPDTGRKFDLVALDETAVVGWGFLWAIDSHAPFLGLGIADAHQGRGIGGTLLDALMQHAGATGKHRVTLVVLQDNHRAIALYESRGFTIQRELIDDQEGYPCFLMEAPLLDK